MCGFKTRMLRLSGDAKIKLNVKVESMCMNAVASLYKVRHCFEVYPINFINRSKLPACLFFAHGMRS